MIDSKNYDEYLQKVGVGWMIRKKMVLVKPELEIRVNFDNWTINSHCTFKDTHLEFTEGKRFYEITEDGRKMKVSPSVPTLRFF